MADLDALAKIADLGIGVLALVLLFAWLWNHRRSEHEDNTLAQAQIDERKATLGLIENSLARLGEMASAMAALTTAVQAGEERAQARFEQTLAQMAAVTDTRTRKLDALHADVRTVPGEVWRLGDPRLETLSRRIRTDLEPLITGLQAAIEDGFQRLEAALAAQETGEREEPAPQTTAEGTDNSGVSHATPDAGDTQAGETASPSEPAQRREDAEGEHHA